jgi:hypothetical protein
MSTVSTGLAKELMEIQATNEALDCRARCRRAQGPGATRLIAAKRPRRLQPERVAEVVLEWVEKI